jgi:glucose uptake protein
VILPATYSAALLLMFVCMFCWGSWANTYKFTTRWRYELFYYDYALGAAVCAAAVAFTLGSMNSQDLTFQDNFLIASTRKIVYGLGAGVLLNIANLLFMAALSVSGMGVAFPISLGLAMVTGVVWNYFPAMLANPLLLFGGAVCVLISVMLTSYAHASYVDSQNVSKPLRVDPRAPGATRRAPAALAVILAVVSGILLGFVFPLVDNVRAGETGVSPYGVAALLAVGILLSTVVFVPFMLNFPVHGQPVEFRAYFRGSKKQHFWGIFGGIVWMAGTIGYVVAINTPTLTPANMAMDFGVVFAAGLLGALWGLLAWREFRGGAYRVKMLLLGMVVLYGAGVAMMALAPAYGK